MQNTATILQVVCTSAVTAGSSRGELCSIISLSVEEQERDLKEQGTINSKQGKERRGRTSATPSWNFSLASLSFTLCQYTALMGQDSPGLGAFSGVQNGYSECTWLLHPESS